MPIITARTVKLGLNYERLNKIIKEAVEQSGRGILQNSMKFNFDNAIGKQKRQRLELVFQHRNPHLDIQCPSVTNRYLYRTGRRMDGGRNKISPIRQFYNCWTR